MNIAIKSLFRIAGVLMLAVPLCFGSMLFFSCDALNFAGLDDGPDTEAGNTDTTDPALPQDDPDATFHIYPPKMFTKAVIRYTDGSYSDPIEIISASKTAFFSVPDGSRTIYEVVFNPDNVSVLIGRNSSEKIHLEFDQNKKLQFRTGISGRPLDPVPVGTYAELVLIRDLHDKSTWTTNSRDQIIMPEYLRANFLQQGDINLFGDISNRANGTYKQWTPIGIIDDNDTSRNVSFNGRYDGNGKKLYNMSIETNAQYQGFFAAIGLSGIVTNLHFSYASVEAGSTSGIICAVNSGTIENSLVSDSSLYKAFVVGGALGLGGICGTNLPNGLIIGSGFIGTVTATDQAGGICGVNNSSIKAVYFFGQVTVDNGFSTAHPIAGLNEGGGMPEKCFWYNPADREADDDGNRLSTSNWPVFPTVDFDPEAGWAEYKQRDGASEDGRWKKSTNPSYPTGPGNPSDTPQRSNLPKLWWQ